MKTWARQVRCCAALQSRPRGGCRTPRRALTVGALTHVALTSSGVRAAASRRAGLVPQSALRGDMALRLRAACNEKARLQLRVQWLRRRELGWVKPRFLSLTVTRAQELELMELRQEHAQLASRFAEAQANMEEALEVRLLPACHVPPQAPHSLDLR
jgi:hypothetical protein